MKINMINNKDIEKIKKELDTMELYDVTVHNLDDSKMVYISVNGLLRENPEINSRLAWGYKIDAPSLIEFLEVNNMAQMEIKKKNDGYTILASHKDYTKRHFTTYKNDTITGALKTISELPDYKNKAAMTLKERLLISGVPVEDIDNHCSDLYVKVSKESTKIISEIYGSKTTATRSIFKSNIDGSLQYEIVFGYPEYYEELRTHKA